MLFKPTRNISQHNVITSSRHHHTALQSNILALLAAKVSVEPEKRTHDISVKELMKLSGRKVSHADVSELSKELRKITYNVKWGDVKETEFETIFSSKKNRLDDDFVSIGPINHAEYFGVEGKLVLDVSDKMKPFFINLTKNMTIYSLQAYLGLRGAYSKRFYLFFCMFRKTGIFKKSLENLKKMLGLDDKYPAYKEFKRRVILPSLKEINEENDKRMEQQ